MEQVQADIHSLNGELDVAQIIQHKDLNHCIAVYKGHLYKAIYNPFSGYYYVDDLYGEIPQI